MNLVRLSLQLEFDTLRCSVYFSTKVFKDIERGRFDCRSTISNYFINHQSIVLSSSNKGQLFRSRVIELVKGVIFRTSAAIRREKEESETIICKENQQVGESRRWHWSAFFWSSASTAPANCRRQRQVRASQPRAVRRTRATCTSIQPEMVLSLQLFISINLS